MQNEYKDNIKAISTLITDVFKLHEPALKYARLSVRKEIFSEILDQLSKKYPNICDANIASVKKEIEIHLGHLLLLKHTGYYHHGMHRVFQTNLNPYPDENGTYRPISKL